MCFIISFLNAIIAFYLVFSTKTTDKRLRKTKVPLISFYQLPLLEFIISEQGHLPSIPLVAPIVLKIRFHFESDHIKQKSNIILQQGA